MQVTTSSQHCSSFRQEVHSSDTSSGTTVTPPQTSWIPRQSGPGNPSWLSTYNITIPEETEPVLSVNNPGDSGIAGAGPASVSDEPGFPESGVAKTPVVKKKKKSGKKSGKSQETAIAIAEETSFVLSMARQGDFRIEKTRPVPMPDKFLYLERNLDKISTLYKGDNLSEAKKKAIAIVKSLKDKPRAEQLIRYLNSVIFLCHVMQDMTFCHNLPAKNSADFIHWMLTIAEAARQESDDLPASSKLMLFCLRWAADAGGQGARQYLVKVLLFRQLCPDMPSPDVHFFPDEALDHLANMARDDTQLPISGNNQDDVINRMVELIKLRNTENLDSRKKELVDFLRHHSQPEMRLLIPFIYTSEVFGPAEYDKARDYLEQFPVPDAEKSVNSPVADVYQFWKLKCTMVPRASHEAGTVRELNQLAQKGFLAAIHLLSKLSRECEDISPTHILSFIRSPDPCFPEYPHLIHSLCRFYFEKTRQQDGVNQQGSRKYTKEILQNTSNFLVDTRIQGDPRIRDYIIWPEFQDIFSKENQIKINRKSVPPLPEDVIQILHNSQYTQDPAALIYMHCAQVLRHGKADQELIEVAERKDVLSTCFYMLMISDATEEMDNVVLANKLLDVLHVKAQDFRAWRDHPGFPDFVKNLFACSILLRNPEPCNLLCLDLLNLMGKMKKYGAGIPIILDSLALGKMKQGNIEEANQYYKQAWEKKDPSQRGANPPRVDESSYRVIRPDLPEYYYQLAAVHKTSFHPLTTRCRFNRLLSVREKMQENKDPALWDAWITKACNLIVFSYWHITPEMCQTLTNHTTSALAKQQDLSFDLLLAASKQLRSMVNNIVNRYQLEGREDFAELITDVHKSEEAISNQTSPHPKAGNANEMARLPNMISVSTYIEQHHIIARAQEAKSIDDIIKHMKKLVMAYDVDSATLIRLLAPRLDSELLLPEQINDLFSILLLLQQRLDEQFHEILRLKIDAESRSMLAMYVYCHHFIGNTNQTMKDIIERMDKQTTDLIIKDPECVMANINDLGNEFDGKEEHNAFCWALLANKFSKRFNGALTHIIKSHHPRVILKIFNKLFTKEECIAKLQELQIKYDDLSHVLKLISYQIKDQKEEILPFLQQHMANKYLSEEQKIQLLWYAYESPLITNNHQIEQAATFINNLSPIGSFFIQMLLVDVRSIRKLRQFATSKTISWLARSHQEELGFKILPKSRRYAANVWTISNSVYPLAMLAWRHNVLSDQIESVTIKTALQISAERGEVKAQCEWIRWLLKQQRDGEKISPELKRKACRLVHLPHPLAGAESILYQGITQYLGFGCEPDLMTGKQKIQEALDKDPLIVALRLYDLKEHRLFALPGDTADYLLRYAQALSERNKDPYNRRDNYFNNLLLSYGSEALQQLLASLRGKEKSDPSNKPVYQQAVHRLSEWLGQWSEGTASPASASRRTSRATASSTKTSPQKTKEAASPANASHKTSRVAASATSAPSRTREEGTCTEDDVEQVMADAMANDWKSGTPDKINQLANRLRREKASLSTETEKKIDDELHTLLTMMPGKLPELAKCADAVINLIRQPEKIAEVILSWIAKLSMALSWNEQAFCLERILTCFPEDHSINLDDHKADVLCFLELLMQHQPIPEKAAYLLDTLSEDERTQLLIKGFPGSINTNPKMYQQHVEAAQPPNLAFVNDIWRALKPESDAKLIRATFTALIKQKSSELHAIKADDGRLQTIDLYNLFSESSLAERETLLAPPSPVLRELLVKSYLQFRKANPGKKILPRHLEDAIRKFVQKKSRSLTKEPLDILIMTREYGVGAALLREYQDKIKQMASEYLAHEDTGCEQRLIAQAILSMIP